MKGPRIDDDLVMTDELVVARGYEVFILVASISNNYFDFSDVRF